MLGNHQLEGGTPKISTRTANGHPHVSQYVGQFGIMDRKLELQNARSHYLAIFLYLDRAYVDAGATVLISGDAVVARSNNVL